MATNAAKNATTSPTSPSRLLREPPVEDPEPLDELAAADAVACAAAVAVAWAAESVGVAAVTT
jgi:hypothetical protein